MRYQNPSIEQAVDHLLNDNVDEIFLIPLFPHYAMSSYETAVEKTKTVLNHRAPKVNLAVQPPFYDHPDYIRALVASARKTLDQDYDHLLFSFHGLPERHLRKSDPSGCHCLATSDCCVGSHPSHNTCYRAQCFKTVNAFLQAANIPLETFIEAGGESLELVPCMNEHPLWINALENMINSFQELDSNSTKAVHN